MTLRTWDPQGVTEDPATAPGIMPHHEVLLRLGAMDLDRGKPQRIVKSSASGFINVFKVQKLQDIEDIT